MDVPGSEHPARPIPARLPIPAVPPISLLRLRGVILNPALRCPVCGGETMRVTRPRSLRAVMELLRVRYRLCRHCMRTWLSWR